MAEHRNLAVLAAVAFLALAPARAEPPTPDAVVNAFEANLGPITTFRPSHPKGT